VKFLLDTCVISEVMKPQPNLQVISWLQSHEEADLFLSVLTFGELEKGITKAQDLLRKKKLKLWVHHDLKQRFENRILTIDANVCERWGVIQGEAELVGKPMPVLDGLIAVTGLVYGCVVVSRNLADMRQCGAELLNPWLEAGD
jgi:toxin FitB